MRTRCLLAGGLALLVASPVLAQPAPAVFDAQVISGEWLVRAGLTRLSDVLWHVDGIRASTVDGYTVQAAFPGHSPAEAPAWQLFIDGQPVDPDVWNASMLDALPVPTGSIDRIEVVTGPAIVAGTFVESGALLVHLRPVADGLSAEASVSAQNETGDPGPYRYTPFAASLPAANVDSHGPDGSAALGHGGDALAVRGTVRYQQHFPTDPALIPRFEAVHTILHAAKTEVAAGGLEARLGRGAAAHVLRASASTSAAFPFVPVLRREVSMRYRLLTAGANGSARAGRVGRAVYGFGLTARRAGDLEPETSRIPVEWRSEDATGNVSVVVPGRAGTTTLGASGVLARAASGFGRADGVAFALARLFLARKGILPAGGRYEAGAMATVDGSQAAARAFAGATFAVGRRLGVGVRGSFAQELAPEQDRLAYWMRRGLGLRGVGAPFHAIQPEARRAAALRLEVGWAWRPAAGIRLRAAGLLRRADPAYVAREARAGLAPERETYEIGYAYASGTTAGFLASASTSFFGGHQELVLDGQRAVSGVEAFREVWEPAAGRQATVRLLQPLPGRLTVAGRAVYVGERSWPVYDRRLPGFVQMDVSFHKRFAGDAVDATLAFENVLGERIRHHPLGATFDLSVRLRIAVSVGGG